MSEKTRKNVFSRQAAPAVSSKKRAELAEKNGNNDTIADKAASAKTALTPELVAKLLETVGEQLGLILSREEALGLKPGTLVRLSISVFAYIDQEIYRDLLSKEKEMEILRGVLFRAGIGTMAQLAQEKNGKQSVLEELRDYIDLVMPDESGPGAIARIVKEYMEKNPPQSKKNGK